MALQIGIVGLPNVGKSTIFNALTSSGVAAENYPFCTIDPNVGVVEVPDSRLKDIAKIYKPKAILPAVVEFVDIAGLVKGASSGEGLGNKFLTHIRDVDAIINVVRCFEDSNVTHVEGALDPIRDVEIIELELLMRDIESIEKRILRAGKKVRVGDKDAKKEVEVLEYILPKMNENILVRDIPLEASQKKFLKPLALLTMKPALYVANVDEVEIASEERNSMAQSVFDFAEKEGNVAIRLCGSIEMEISTMDEEDKPMFLEEYNLPEPGLHKLIHAAYRLLDLETFFTAGKEEVRAWTIPLNTTAPEAAGKIHTDFQRGFIKAEVFKFEDLMKFGTELAVKEAGKIRQEGKTYKVVDGDLMFFKFNV